MFLNSIKRERAFEAKMEQATLDSPLIRRKLHFTCRVVIPDTNWIIDHYRILPELVDRMLETKGVLLISHVVLDEMDSVSHRKPHLHRDITAARKYLMKSRTSKIIQHTILDIPTELQRKLNIQTKNDDKILIIAAEISSLTKKNPLVLTADVGFAHDLKTAGIPRTASSDIDYLLELIYALNLDDLA